MAVRLQEIIRSEDVMKNSFRNRERVELFQRNLARETNDIVVWETLPRLAEGMNDNIGAHDCTLFTAVLTHG